MNPCIIDKWCFFPRARLDNRAVDLSGSRDFSTGANRAPRHNGLYAMVLAPPVLKCGAKVFHHRIADVSGIDVVMRPAHW